MADYEVKISLTDEEEQSTKWGKDREEVVVDNAEMFAQRCRDVVDAWKDQYQHDALSRVRSGVSNLPVSIQEKFALIDRAREALPVDKRTTYDEIISKAIDGLVAEISMKVNAIASQV